MNTVSSHATSNYKDHASLRHNGNNWIATANG